MGMNVNKEEFGSGGGGGIEHCSLELAGARLVIYSHLLMRVTWWTTSSVDFNHMRNIMRPVTGSR